MQTEEEDFQTIESFSGKSILGKSSFESQRSGNSLLSPFPYVLGKSVSNPGYSDTRIILKINHIVEFYAIVIFKNDECIQKFPRNHHN